MFNRAGRSACSNLDTSELPAIIAGRVLEGRSGHAIRILLIEALDVDRQEQRHRSLL